MPTKNDLDGRKAGPHQAKLCALPWNTRKCKRGMTTYKRLAEGADDGFGAGEGNAVRHAVWAALNAKTNGAGFT